MAKNFGKAGSAKTFENTKKTEQEKAQVVTLQNIRNENLLNYPKNGEDISFTADLEESMRQNGYTDPMEVTDFGMENGKYMIVSGHRRRVAGVIVFGEEFAFPCIIRHFESEEDVHNYVLFANSQRDSARDPLLFCGRYKMHEEYLKSINFNGNMREEIAKRLGISVQQADRYNAINKVILPVWDMIRAEIVGMSSVQPMAKHSEEEQTEIYDILQGALKKDVTLTRDVVKKIVDGYRNGKRTWEEIADLPRDSGLPLTGIINTEPSETREQGEKNRNDEVRHDFDPIAAEYDKMDEDKAEWEREQEEITQNNETEEKDVENEKNNPIPEEKPELTAEEKQLKLGADIAKQLSKLDTNLQDFWKCENESKAKEMIINMGTVARILVDEMYRLSEEWNIGEEFEKTVGELKSEVGQY